MTIMPSIPCRDLNRIWQRYKKTSHRLHKDERQLFVTGATRFFTGPWRPGAPISEKRNSHLPEFSAGLGTLPAR
jgi:hypothetical protein